MQGLEILACQSSPTVDIECTPDGELRLQGVRRAAFQILRLRRQLDVGDEDTAPVRAQLKQCFFERDDVVDGLLTALHAQLHIVLLGPLGTAKSALVDALVEGEEFDAPNETLTLNPLSSYWPQGLGSEKAEANYLEALLSSPRGPPAGGGRR